MRLTLPPNKKIARPRGKPDSKICLIGEQPGKQEIFQGRVFVGPSGKELGRCLREAGILEEECYLTNVVKDYDKSIDHYFNLQSKKGPFPLEEGKLYLEYLKQELEETKANVFVAVGNIALFALTERIGVTKWRGSVLESTLLPGRKVIPIIHPATILPPKNVYLNRYLIIWDLQKTLRESEFPEIRRIERQILIGPSFVEARGFLEECLTLPVVDFDIEVVGNKVSCIAFAQSPTRAMSIPFVGPGGDYFTPDKEAEIWILIAKILENPNITKRGQNLTFDISWLLQEFGIKTKGPLHDTMLAQKISYPDFKAGLDFITSIHTDLPYYKAEGKKWLKIGGPWESFWTYNATDSLATASASESQQMDLFKLGNIDSYNDQVELIKPLSYMSVKGIKVDVQGMKKEAEDTKERIERLQEQLNRETGKPINFASTKQLNTYFYDNLGIDPYLNRKTHKPTTDAMAMKRLSRKGISEAQIILDLRTQSKRLSVYLNQEKIDKDGRYRSAYNPMGARTGRLSSSENIRGTGGNQQNWPHDLLRFLIADDGYVIYSMDLSQIENRIVANVGRVHGMLEAFELGQDLHKKTASLIFGVPVDEVSDEPGSAPLGGGKFSQRFWGKKTNHAANYDMGYKTFALQVEIPETEAKWLLNRYHQTYPEVRGVYHAMIKNQLSRNRTLTNLFGRKRVFLGQWGDDLFKEAFADIPQSTTAYKINKHGMVYIYENQQKFQPIELLSQVHDAIYFQVPLSVPWSTHAEMIWDIKQKLETPLTTPDGLQFKTPSDLTLGLNMCKEESIEFKHSKFPPSIEQLTIELERGYSKLIERKTNAEESS